MSHHSLVTPIDWKLTPIVTTSTKIPKRHHSLVTPIEWKPRLRPWSPPSRRNIVTTRW